ncbi:MAG: hypothetical protein U0936_22085 [Planctomycetaceae bacterium]
MPMKRKEDSIKPRGGGIDTHRKNRKVASATATAVTLDPGPSRAVLDGDRFLERLVRMDQRLERIEDLLQRKAQASPEQAAKACSSRGRSEVDTQELGQSVVGEPVHELNDDYGRQPSQDPSTNVQSNESQQAPANEPDAQFDDFDEFYDEIASQPLQTLSVIGQSSKSHQAPVPEEFDEFAEEDERQPPQRPGSNSQSNEPKQALDPKKFDEFADEFAEDEEPQPPQRRGTNSHSSEPKQARDPEEFDEFAEFDE